MPEGGLCGVRHSPQAPGGDIDLCDLGPGDLTVGAGGSELLLHVDPVVIAEAVAGEGLVSARL